MAKPRQGQVQKKKKLIRRQQRTKMIVPGWGGFIGRGLGLARKTFTTQGSIANKALKLARRVADAVNIEYKHSDYGIGTLRPDYSGTTSLISVPSIIPQGITDSERVGDSLKMQNYTMRYYIFDDPARTGTIPAQMVRCVVFIDPQNQIATAADLLQVTGTNIAPISPKDYDKRFRSRVLYDKTHYLDNNHPSIPAQDVVLMINEHTQFENGTTTVNTGDLKVLFISNVQGPALVPYVQFYGRLTFTDD